MKALFWIGFKAGGVFVGGETWHSARWSQER
jgi:hypothetical protein